MNKNQQGFSVLEALLILILVVIIVGTGWYVYSADKKANSTYSAAAKSSQSTAKFTKKN